MSEPPPPLVTADPWESLRHMTLDQLVTQTKLGGSASGVQGHTTPEGYPFAIVVAVATPGNERVMDFAREFHEKMVAAGARGTYAWRIP